MKQSTLIKVGTLTLDISQYGYLAAVISSKKDNTYKVVEMTGTHPNINTKIIADNIAAVQHFYNYSTIEAHNKSLK